jgi:hypothetical protein
MTTIARLEDEFNADMWQILEKEREVGWCSTRFREMLETLPGVDVAHRLLKTNPNPMFAEARRLGRQDLTMEHYVDLPKYKSLFSPQERAAAAWRLNNGA